MKQFNKSACYTFNKSIIDDHYIVMFFNKPWIQTLDASPLSPEIKHSLDRSLVDSVSQSYGRSSKKSLLKNGEALPLIGV